MNPTLAIALAVAVVPAVFAVASCGAHSDPGRSGAMADSTVGQNLTGIGGKCLDVYEGNSNDGATVGIWTCHGGDNQSWTYTAASTLVGLDGKCLDVAGAGTADGTRVQLYTCNGTVAQTWKWTDGALVNPNSGKCLDVTGDTYVDGSLVEIWDCWGGPNQQWAFPTTTTPPAPTSDGGTTPVPVPPAGTDSGATDSGGTTTTPTPTPMPDGGGGRKATMMAWLTSLQGKGAMPVQQLLGQSNDITSVQNTFNASGKWVAGLGGNYYNNDDSLSPEPFGTQANSVLIDWWKAGGMVWLSGFNWPNPSGGGGQTGPVDAGGLVTAGSPTNAAWHAILDQVAGGIQELVDAGVVVMFRPLHEQNGNWFWWGTTYVSDDQFVALWRDTYEYLTGHYNFADNIIWVYAVNGENDHPNRYPGDDYVDVVGFDWYTNQPSSGSAVACYDSLSSYHKPVGWCEWGGDQGENEMDIVNALKTVPQTIYWEQWSTQWSIDNMSNVSAAMNDPWVLTRDRLNRP